MYGTGRYRTYIPAIRWANVTIFNFNISLTINTCRKNSFVKKKNKRLFQIFEYAGALSKMLAIFPILTGFGGIIKACRRDRVRCSLP